MILVDRRRPDQVEFASSAHPDDIAMRGDERVSAVQRNCMIHPRR